MEVKIEGLREIEAALYELKSGTARSVARRVLKGELEPFIEQVASAAPKDEGDLKESFAVSSRLTRSQRMPREGDWIWMHGGTNHPQGMWQEYGTWSNPAQPYFRPLWEGQKAKLLSSVASSLATEVSKSAARARKKALRNA